MTHLTEPQIDDDEIRNTRRWAFETLAAMPGTDCWSFPDMLRAASELAAFEINGRLFEPTSPQPSEGHSEGREAQPSVLRVPPLSDEAEQSPSSQSQSYSSPVSVSDVETVAGTAGGVKSPGGEG